MKRIWIKLYLDILDDPRMGLLPPPVWKRAVELFLIAGETGDANDGRLPSLQAMAWRLRTSPGDLRKTLRALAGAGILHREADGAWVVSEFASRQEPVTSTERVREYRKRLQSAEEEPKRFNQAEAAAAETFPSSSDSASDSQGERVQGEGDGTKPARKRHAPRAASSAQVDYALNAGTREAERLLLRVARLAALPPGEVPRIEQVAALAARYGPEKAERELTAQHERWIATVSEKTGKTYSPLNFGWVDWADAVLAGLPQPGPQPVELEPLYDGSEYDEMVSKAVPPPPEIAETLARMEARVAQRAEQP